MDRHMQAIVSPSHLWMQCVYNWASQIKALGYPLYDVHICLRVRLFQELLYQILASTVFISLILSETRHQQDPQSLWYPIWGYPGDIAYEKGLRWNGCAQQPPSAGISAGKSYGAERVYGRG